MTKTNEKTYLTDEEFKQLMGMSWQRALAREETRDRNALVTESVLAAQDKDVVSQMGLVSVHARNFGPISALELAFKLFLFLEEHDALDILLREE